MSYISIWEFFTNPILLASTIGSMLMCLAASLVGVIIFIRRRSLLGEALSHASYPGIALSVLLCATFFPTRPEIFPIAILVGAFIFGFLGMRLIIFMEHKLSINSDSALTFTLSTFLGVGILLVSKLQFSHPIWFQQVQMFLYGQAATMTTIHILFYALLSSLILLFVLLYHPQIKAVSFDGLYAKIIGIK